MSDTIFPYPGGKSLYSGWITQFLPDHETYIEAFGGGAGVLLNKRKSPVEVYNDVNQDLVVFFRVLRNRPSELQAFVERMPYSRAEYERVATKWHQEGHRPEDNLKRAAWFYFLQQTTFSSKLEKSGFSIAKTAKDNRARAYKNSSESLAELAERFKGVTIECLDYRELVDRYDWEDAFFYFDPPYVDVGDEYYGHEGKFDHQAFRETLEGMDGDWLVSYNVLPDGFDEWNVAEREQRYTMSRDHDTKTERLVMNYNPQERDQFRGGQSGLDTFT